MKTFQAKKEEVDHQWYLVNAEGKILGRLATELAKILRGKEEAIFTPTWIPGTLWWWSMPERWP